MLTALRKLVTAAAVTVLASVVHWPAEVHHALETLVEGKMARDNLRRELALG